LFESIPDAGAAAPSTIQRLDAIMNNPRVLVGQRAQAAAYAAAAYFQGGDRARACDRIREALTLDPSTASYRATLTNFQCGT